MKKIVIIILGIIVSLGAFAQIKALKDSTYTFRVSPVPTTVNYTYHWKVSGGTTTDLSTTTVNVVTLKWDNAVLNTTDTVKVYATSAEGCNGDDKSKVFLIVDSLDYNGSWVSGASVCPQTTKNPNGGNDAYFEIKVNVIKGNALKTTDEVTVFYWLNNLNQSFKVFPDANNVVKIPVVLADADKINFTSSPKEIPVVVTGLQISGRSENAIPDGMRAKGVIKVLASPVITDIF